MEVRLSALIGPGFFESHKAVRAGCGELLESGGRGSGKSSYLSVELVLQMVKHPNCHSVVLRKVGATIRTSVYAQLRWAVEALGLGAYFRFTLSPLEAVYLPTGQRILFFGMDDAGKLKSIKVPKGYIGIVWFEELDQFEAEEVRSAEQSLFRGGNYSLCMKSFNPPADPEHWVNRLGEEEKPGRHFHHSTYLELPEGWLGQRFLADAAHLKRSNPVLYQHEYLGMAVGVGQKVFLNVQLASTEEVVRAEKELERFSAGVDWGWWPDPWAFNRVAFDEKRRRLWILEEASAFRTSNQETGRMVLERIGSEEILVADSSEKKSVEDYRAMGIRCRAAKKGPGSVEYSMKWLQSLEAIVIDRERCPNTVKEFTGYCYEDGRYPDRNNHHIDAVRYATGHLWRRKMEEA